MIIPAQPPEYGTIIAIAAKLARGSYIDQIEHLVGSSIRTDIEREQMKDDSIALRKASDALRSRVADLERLQVGREMLTDTIEKIEAENTTLRGAMAAQDAREREAGDLCGVSYAEHGCDWPAEVADVVLSLRADIATLRAKGDALAEAAREVVASSHDEEAEFRERPIISGVVQMDSVRRFAVIDLKDALAAWRAP